MFSNEHQKALTIRLLLSPYLEHFWTENGPTEQASDYLDNGAPLSSGEMIMLRVAFDFWNGNGGAKFADVANRLDSRNTALVASLMAAVASGSHAVNQWIDDRLEQS